MESRLGLRVCRATKVLVSAVLALALLAGLSQFLWTLANEPRPFPGYTLIAPLRSTMTYLLDMQGTVVRTWQSRYGAGQDAYLLENGHLIRAAEILDEERLFSSPTAGGRIQEFTWEGELVWDFKFHNEKQIPHHDFKRLPNGNVLLIVWEIKTAEETIASGREQNLVDGPWLADSLIEIKPTGKAAGEVVWEWHVWDHLVQDRDPSKANYGQVAAHPELIDINFGQLFFSETTRPDEPSDEETQNKKEMDALRSIGYVRSSAARGNPGFIPDWTHFNAVAYDAERDQIMVTVRAFSEFWIIDHSTTSAEAKGHRGGVGGMGGDLLYRWGNPRAYRAGTEADQKLFAAHDAHWIPRGCPGEGHVLVFNNGIGRPGADYSSVEELVLPMDARGRYMLEPGMAYGPKEPVWQYVASKPADFFAGYMSGAQRLPNGDTLICDSMGGTLFEVARNKAVVWKYIYDVTGVPRPVGTDASPGGSGSPLPRQEILPPPLRDTLRMSPAQNQDLDHLQYLIDDKLDKILTDEQKQRINDASSSRRGGLAGFAMPGQIMSLSRQRSLKMTDEQRKQLTDLQKDVDDKLGRALTDNQKARLAELKVAANRSGPPGIRPSGSGSSPRSRSRVRNPVFRAYRYGLDYAGLVGKKMSS
jgi:hypothetical protein